MRSVRILMFLTAVAAAAGAATPRPWIFPPPREMAETGSGFLLDDQVVIAVPSYPSAEDLFLARSLAEDLGDRFGVHLRTERVETLGPQRRAILMGSLANPLLRDFMAARRWAVSPRDPGPEGYVLRTDADTAVVVGSDDRGAFYGLQSLRQLAAREGGRFQFRGVNVRDWPAKPFRGVKLYLPGRYNIPFFKRFVRDFMALYKYNTLIMEMNASMRFAKHPELNTGWIKFAQDTNYSRRNYPPGAPHDWEQNSTHQDTADGGYLEKDEVADLAQWVRRYHIELVPELPSFTHSYYLMTEHKELSEVPGVKWPGVYCPSNPASYKLLFDVYDEYIELLKPRLVHAGHDELFQAVGMCPRCKDKDIGERYGEDVRTIHDYLASKGIRMAIWGDMLLEGVRGKGLQTRHAPDGFSYKVAGGMTPEQVNRLVPKDVLIFNWFWSAEEGSWTEAQAEGFEGELEHMGFQQVFGNFYPSMQHFATRIQRASILGGAPSAWFATNETGFGKDLLSDFLGCAYMLWRGDTLYGRDLSGTIQAMLPEIRARFRGEEPPSQTEESIAPVNISSRFNIGIAEPKMGVNFAGIRSGTITAGRIPFDLAGDGASAIIVGTDGVEKSGLPREIDHIAIGEDATSLVFLHAAARPATNKEEYRLLWDPDDTADLLGWYEVVYEDGFVTTIPIRYGVNIQEWNWEQRTSAKDYCYGADAVSAGDPSHPITFFAFEWKNPRLGKKIVEIRLKGTSGFRGGDPDFTNDYGPTIPANAIILKAISIVRKRG
ncbi:MAG TPA: beta-N-acetylhexosaminidase [Bryobacteraceae bacterium]|nr:beta-N-acetylhexosaminidase [Bryobacteraceae bacterium]